MNRLIIFLSFLLAWSSVGAEDDPLVALKKGQPADVAAVVDRLVGCVHFAGEEGYDAERKREIATAMKKLKCDRLDKDETEIRKRYSNRPDVLKVLKQAKEWGG
jgi:hypothetical protein